MAILFLLQTSDAKSPPDKVRQTKVKEKPQVFIDDSKQKEGRLEITIEDSNYEEGQLEFSDKEEEDESGESGEEAEELKDQDGPSKEALKGKGEQKEAIRR